MKRLILATFLIFTVTSANATGLIPNNLVGIWATEGSKFSGEALMKGQALYIDTDGVGASIGGDGKAVVGARVVVTSYNPKTNLIQFNITEAGKVIGNGSLTYDPIKKLIFSSKDLKQTYIRVTDEVSSTIRKSLGLEAKSN